MDTQNDMFETPCIEYRKQSYGDLISGTKEQLQGLGIAVGMAFPGEEGGPKRHLIVKDPRGYKCDIREWYNHGIAVFFASIPFPGRDQPIDERVSFASGVHLTRSTRTDDYVGTAESLVASGLIRLDQLPGQPGMRKVRVTILPNGSLPTGAPNAYCSEAKAPGAKSIRRVSKSTYEVSIFVDEDEQTRRDIASTRRRDAWEARMMAMPRPAPLNASLSLLRKIEKTRVIPKCRTIGNVIYLPRT